MSDAATLIDALVEALERGSGYNANDQVPPVAILWPDKERQWEPLLPELCGLLPIITLGPYAPQDRTGPAYYLRCMIGRTLADDQLPADAVPIVYLPGVSRQELRAIDECPKHLQPLAELQYRGVLWTHRNGRDWTVSAFLQNADGGLGIAVAGDTATRDALLRALPVLAREPLAHLRHEAPLRAPFLDALLNPDEVRRLLLWMNDPTGFRAGASTDEWVAFCNLIGGKYGMSPEEDGELLAGQRLGQGAGPWVAVWQRYQEAPEAYPNLPDLLRRARPQQRTLFEPPSPYWPQDNDAAEAGLREQLSALANRNPNDARAAILELEEKHGARRAWVWAKMGRAPLARALQHLAQLASATETALGGPTADAIAEAYAAWGWQADAAVIDALACVEAAADVGAVRDAIVSVYRPWLDQAATAFQQAVLPNPIVNYQPRRPDTPTPGTCVLFSDALRYDVAQRLAQALGRRGIIPACGWRLAALPTVTSTTKPALVPLGDAIAAGAPGLSPVSAESGAPLTADGLRKLLRAAGYQVLTGDEMGDPSGIAWTEIGAIDQYGHGHGWRVASHLSAELRAIEGRIVALLEAGWRRVEVVSDHGWLLLPGGLPKVELAQQLTLERKGRCAVLKEGATTGQPTVPWYWDRGVSIAMAPGIACYEAGHEYEHGGLSPQECVVPVLCVELSADRDRPRVEIKKVSWRGLRCVVEAGGTVPGLLVDIRTKAADPATSLLERPKAPDADGVASLPVPDDDHEGEAAFVVVYMEDGAVLAQDHTTVGG